MTLRRISLTLALLTAPAWADDLDDLDETPRHSARSQTSGEAPPRLDSALVDVVLRPDGSIASLATAAGNAPTQVPWSYLRLVLPDVLGEPVPSRSIQVEVGAEATRGASTHRSSAEPTGFVSLRELTGLPVVDEQHELVGVVRGAVLCMPDGVATALSVEIESPEGAAPRVVALPWFALDTREAIRLGRAQIDADAANWIRSAPELGTAGDAVDPGEGERAFSPRFDGSGPPDELLGDWSDPR